MAVYQGTESLKELSTVKYVSKACNLLFIHEKQHKSNTSQYLGILTNLFLKKYNLNSLFLKDFLKR